MLVKEFLELEDCEQCPFYKESCSGGMTSSPSGIPIEPPCTSWDDNDDLDELYGIAIKKRLAHEEYLERKWEAEEERKRKNKEKARKAREARIITAFERKEIKRLRKQIKNNNTIMHMADSFANAFNTTNEMFGYEERIDIKKEKHPLEIENKKLQEKIDELDKVRKEKLKELRIKRKENAKKENN